MRGNTNQVVRDNVLFELGLFIGRLGSERSFFLIPDNAADLRLPSDLAGVTPGRYEGARTDGNWMAALNPACMQIKMQMTRLKPFQDAPLNDVAPIPIEKETTTTSFKGKIYLEEYKNSYLIKGDTKPIRSDLKAWASWNPNLAAWVLPKTKKDDFESEFADLLS